MKKGFLTLMVTLLTLVGTVGFAATLGLWGIPDVIIGDLEDQTGGALTDNFFVFPDALDFDDYWTIASTGTFGYIAWIFYDAVPDKDIISINGLVATQTSDAYAISTLASFRNLATTPIGGPYTSRPAVPTSSPIEVFLSAANVVGSFSYAGYGDLLVFTVDEANDSLTNEFYRFNPTGWTDVVMSADPGWTLFTLDATVDENPPFGLHTVDGGYNATSDTLWMETSDADFDFGAWMQVDLFGTASSILADSVPFIAQRSYILSAGVWADPVVPLGQDAFHDDFVPAMRVRCNSVREDMSAQLDIQSSGGGTLVPSTDPASPTTETLVFDPRDQSGDLAGLYCTFDLVDFSAFGRTPNELDEEGIVGITFMDVDVFPTKMLQSSLANITTVQTLPTGANFDAHSAEFTKTTFASSGNLPNAGVDSDGNFLLSSSFVERGFAIYQMNVGSSLALAPDDSKWYVYRFKVKPSNFDCPWMRFRVAYADFQRTVDVDVKQDFWFDGRQFIQDQGAATATYNIYFAPVVGHTAGLIWAFDMIDFDASHGDTNLALVSLKVETFSPPGNAP